MPRRFLEPVAYRDSNRTKLGVFRLSFGKIRV